MATFSDVLTPPSETETESLILSSFRSFGLKVTAWQKFSVPRTMLELTKRLYPALRTGLANTVNQRLTHFASGAGLDYLAEQWFELDRDRATPTVGAFVLADDGGAPIDVMPGSLKVRDRATGLIFVSAETGTVPSGGELSLSFKAEKTGAAYNVAPDSDLEVVDVDGIAVTNPPDLMTGTWITTPGTDEQADESLQDECDAQWDSPGCGDDAYYLHHIQQEVPEITKLRTREGVDDYGESLGRLWLVLATDTGEPTTDMVNDATAVARRVRPVGLREFVVVGAGEVGLEVEATVYVDGSTDTYYAGLEERVAAYNKDIHIGEGAYVSRILSILHGAGVRRVDFTRLGPVTPPADQPIDPEQIIRLDVSAVTAVAA